MNSPAQTIHELSKLVDVNHEHVVPVQRPFIILSPAEVAEPETVAALRRSGCVLLVAEKQGGPTVPLDKWLEAL